MYKILQNGKVVDVVKYPTFISFLPTGHIAIVDKSSAQGIVGSDNETLYSFVPNDQIADIALIEKISSEEFNRLQNLLNSKQKLTADEILLEKAKQSKIEILSAICNNKITSGFSIKLLDGKTYSFKLALEDQVNLTLIENQLASGANSCVYHATGQPCKVFEREDMLKIITAFRKHVLFHTTYFNAAKYYILALTDIESVDIFTYGTDITNSVKDSALRKILRTGGILE